MVPGITSSDTRYGNIILSYLKKWQEPLNPRLHNYDSEMDIVYARAFIAYMMGNLFFSNGVTSLRTGYLAALTDCDILGTSGFDWGTPIMATLYQGIDEASILRPGKVKKSITGFYVVLEYWFFEYCRVGMYLVKVHNFNHIYPRISGQRYERASTGSEIHHSFVVIRDMIEWKDKTNIDWQPWHMSRQLRRPEVSIASALSTQRIPLVSVPYGHGTLWNLGDRCMCQMTGLDSVPYDPPQEIIEFPRYDRELYQSLRDVNFYDAYDYLVPDVDYMTYWRLVHPNPNIGCTLVKRTGNIWYHTRVYLGIVRMSCSIKTKDYGKIYKKTTSTPIIVEELAQAEELNPVITRSNMWTRRKAKSKRKTTSTPIIVEDVLEASEDVHYGKEQYSNSKNWSSDDFVNRACAWSQVSQSLTTTNNQKAATFWFKRSLSSSSSSPSLMERPPENDVCSICHDNFNLPSQANCSHWFCSSCIMRVWHHGSALQPCKCPICRRAITLLIPSEEFVQDRHDAEDDEVLVNIERYNRRFGGGTSSLSQRLQDLPFFLRRLLRELMDPQRSLPLVFRARMFFAMLLSVIYILSPIDIIPEGILGIIGILDDILIALIFFLHIAAIYRTTLLSRHGGSS
ncbi:hypothetical protein GIB67_014389 [Kingdonia uniflora]|uniref:E3 ubiquitin-protein ligase RNF170 n=1 Tax=Kingdonia uniflora TaxID=39325 RepID=A0A7J7LYX5_9MAGN|nr:hypothetical protein GIB67_014389 [Kingdonia uniflora]